MQRAGALGGYLAAGDGSDCVDADDVSDETEKGEDDEDRVVLTSSPAAAAGGDEK